MSSPWSQHMYDGKHGRGQAIAPPIFVPTLEDFMDASLIIFNKVWRIPSKLAFILSVCYDAVKRIKMIETIAKIDQSEGKNMDLRQLTTFRAVAQTLSFHRAATQLNYVQSSVSTQIQLLEEELGVKLFDRLGKRVVLTEAGQQLLHYAEKLLNLAEEARTAIMDGDGPKGILTMSAPETLWTYRLPTLLKRFRERFPLVQLQFRHYSSKELLQRVQEGAVDVAFVLDEPLLSTTVSVERLVPEPLLIIAAPDSPLACLPEVGPLDLDGQQLLLTEAGCSYRNIFYRALAAEGVHANSVLEFASVEAIKQCVMVGLGIAVLPSIVVEREIAQGKLVALPWQRSPEARFAEGIVTQIIWHKDKWLSPSLQAFLNLTREMLTHEVQVAST